MPGDLALMAHIAVKSSAAVSLAAVGEVLAERAGVLNLGVEGMLLLGALAGAAAGMASGDPLLGLAAGALAGGLAALLHAFFAVGLGADQTLSGLALALLGAGLANFLGRPLVGLPVPRLAPWPIPGLVDLPLLGSALFSHTLPVYLALAAPFAAAWLIFRSPWGLVLRAVGEDARAADRMGLAVARVRVGCVLAGGLMAGLAGASLSLAYTPGWKEGISGGMGWIAIAMVLFSGWRPLRAAAGALFFGTLTALQYHFQIENAELIPAFVLKMLPYLLTLGVLCLAQGVSGARRAAGPACLGQPFRRED